MAHNYRNDRRQFDSVRGSKMSLVYEYWEQRFLACERCAFKKKWFGHVLTCGEPVIGEVILHNGEEVKLCGCVMAIKTKIETAKCPINNWTNDTSQN